jgi:hypothetical protein
MNEDRSCPYRCQVSADTSHAVIRARGRKLNCQVLDLSRDDFHVRIPKGRSLVSKAKKIEVFYKGEHWLVAVDSKDAPADELYLQRLDELTPMEKPCAWATLSRLNLSSQTDPRFVMTLLLAFIFACLALPGRGDKLGTAPKVKNGIHSIFDAFK